MRFKVEGPFEIEKNGRIPRITNDSVFRFGENLKRFAGLADAVGCYVFAMRAGKGIKPWYVGRTNRQSLLSESFHETKLVQYNDVILEQKKGTPVLFFIPVLTTDGKHYRTNRNYRTVEPAINFLEIWLIGEALKANKDLLNKKSTKMLRELHVAGIFNSKQGEASKSSQALRQTLNH